MAGLKPPVHITGSPVAGLKPPVHITGSPVAGLKPPVHITGSPLAGLKINGYPVKYSGMLSCEDNPLQVHFTSKLLLGGAQGEVVLGRCLYLIVLICP